MAKNAAPRRSIEDRLPLAVELSRAQSVYRLALDRALESIGVTARQFAALARLETTPGLSNAELARQSHVTPQTMNVILGRLEAAGLVARRPHPGHGLILLAELTPTGREMVDHCYSRVEAVEACALGALDKGQRRLMVDLLIRVGDRLARLPSLPQAMESVSEPGRPRTRTRRASPSA